MTANRLIIAGLLILTFSFLLYQLVRDPSPQTAPEITSVTRPTPQPAVTPPAPVTPADPPATQPTPPLEQPVEPQPAPATEQVEEVAEAEPQVVPLPPLNESDDYTKARIAGMGTGLQLLRLMASDEIIRKFVVLTDNVSRGELPLRDLPLKPLQAPIQVREQGNERYIMEPGTHARFDPLVNTLTAIDAEQALAVYNTLLPLFHRAYAEIGYPAARFDETLVRAIDNVLNARKSSGPFQLVLPSVMYEYADPRLEDFTGVEKLLLRMGPENSGKLKTKLREFKAQL